MMRQNSAMWRARRSTGGPGWSAALLLMAAMALPLHAQFGASPQSPFMSGINPFGNARGGFQLYDVTGFASWQSVATPSSGFFLPNTSGLGGDELFGGSVAAGWTRRGSKWNMGLNYSANYIGRVRYSEWNALGHYANFSANRRLNAKWDFGFSASAVVSTYDQMLSSPTVFGSLAAAPGSFDDLASAVLAGKYNNDQLASLLTGVPLIESPARTAFFGNRVFNSAASLSLRYAHSPRMSVHFAASAGETQHLRDHGGADVPQYQYLIPRAISGSASLGISYSVSPRTQVGFEVAASRGFSYLQSAYTTYATANIGRTMGRHWFASAHAGAGFVEDVRSRYASNLRTTPVFGANLGYRTFAHTLMVGYSESLSQSYGVGPSENIATTAAWHWWQPGRSWGLTSSYVREQLRNGVFSDVNGWQGTFGLTRRMGRHAMIESAYVYGSFSGHSPLYPYSSQQSSVRLTVMWTPQPMGER